MDVIKVNCKRMMLYDPVYIQHEIDVKIFKYKHT